MCKKLFILIFFVIYFISDIYSQEMGFTEMKKKVKDIEYSVDLKIIDNNANFKVTISFPKEYFRETIILSAKPSLSGVITKSDWESQKYAGENVKNLAGAETVNFSTGGTFSFTRSYELSSELYGELIFTLTLYIKTDKLTEYSVPFILQGNKVVDEIVTDKIENEIINKDDENIEIDDTIEKTEIITVIDTIDSKIKIEDLKTEIENKINEKKYIEVVELQTDLGGIYEDEQKIEEAINTYRDAIEYSEKNKTTVTTGDLYTEVAKLEYYTSKNMEAINDYYEAIDRYEEKGEKKRIELTYNNIATIYNTMLYYENAIEAFTKALNNCTSDDKESKAKYNSKIADAYLNMEKLQESVTFYEQAISLEEGQGNISELVSSLNNFSIILQKQGEYEKATTTIEKAIDLNSELGDNYNEALLYNNLASIYFKLKKVDLALEYYEKAIEKSLLSANYRSNAISLHNIGIIYLEEKNIEKAKEKFNESIKIAEDKGYGDIISKNYFMLSQSIAENIDCAEDFNEYQEFLFESSSILNNDISPMLDYHEKYSNEGLTRDELIEELTQKDIEIQNQKKLTEEQSLKNNLLLLEKQIVDTQNKRQKKTIGFLIGGILLILTLGLIALREYILKRKANKTLIEKNGQILMQNEEIKTQSEELLDMNEKIIEQKRDIENINQKILSSIVYAQNIQNAILPSKYHLDRLLQDYFVLYKPKDVVSGDFYWITQKDEDEIILVAADCTGHGVPGAMMSMLGITLLNEIVNENKIYQPNQIVEKLRDMIISLLNTDFENSNNKINEDLITRDGMDLALLKINKNKLKLYYVGAENPLIIIRDKEIIEIEPDFMPVGATNIAIQKKNFTTREIDLKHNDMIYIFSDGYADQFGGESKPHKFMKKNLLNLYSEISDKDTLEQRNILNEKFEMWKGKNKQIDDVLIFGIRI
jgi:serine phosphatase RsbU (regulator of sigma subunit)/tetratricopeptide (TPR) repeat protein